MPEEGYQSTKRREATNDKMVESMNTVGSGWRRTRRTRKTILVFFLYLGDDKYERGGKGRPYVGGVAK
jgi:hypothetical protein